MPRKQDDYFNLTHGGPMKSSLLNRRQQQANYLEPLELPSLPPLSQLLPTDTAKVEVVASTGFTQPTQMIYDYTMPEQYQLNTQLVEQPPTADIVAAAAAAASMMTFDPMYGLPVTDMNEYNRTRQPSNTSHSSTEKIYSFVEIPGTNQKKRPRRRYDEIERLYHCNWPGCTKAYGTLNHLNAHVSMQKHGPKRNPAEFKEMRKEWRKQKKEKENQKKNEQPMMNGQNTFCFNQIPTDSLSGFY